MLYLSGVKKQLGTIAAVTLGPPRTITMKSSNNQL